MVHHELNQTFSDRKPWQWPCVRKPPDNMPPEPLADPGAALGRAGGRAPRATSHAPTNAVGRLQRLLHIRVNRLFDRRTWLAVRGFQRRHGLLVDGEVGPATWAALTHRGSGGSGGGHHRSLAARALAVARQYAGVPYVWGGSTPKGFDCSGLIQYAYAQQGITLPRVSTAQALTGQEVAKSLDALARGDILTFASQPGGSKVSHVGLYLGEGRFIHSSSSRGVMESTLSGTDPNGQWWFVRWVGARRVIGQQD